METKVDVITTEVKLLWKVSTISKYSSFKQQATTQIDSMSYVNVFAWETVTSCF